jgi:hypothetical protein
MSTGRSNNNNNNDNDNMDNYHHNDDTNGGGVALGGGCFNAGRAIIQNDDQQQHQQREREQQATTIFMENQADNKVVNLTRNSPSYASSQNESWRVNNSNNNNNSFGGYCSESDDDINYCDLNPSEKEKFVKYMQIDGMTLEEASSRVLHERSLGINIITNMEPPNPGGPPAKRSSSKKQQQKPSLIVSQHQPEFRSEVMEDGETMVHHEIPKQQQKFRHSARSIINPCSSNNLNLLNGVVDDSTNTTTKSNYNNVLQQPRAMVLSEASSQVSSSYSYDDRDFAKALEEDSNAMA